MNPRRNSRKPAVDLVVSINYVLRVLLHMDNYKYRRGCGFCAFWLVAIRAQFWVRSLELAASASKKETQEKESDSSVPPVPEGKEGRAFIYISFESGRPVITAAALALFLLPLLSYPRKVSLSFPSRSAFLLLFAARSLSLFPFPSLPVSTHNYQHQPRHAGRHLRPIPPILPSSGPLADRIIKVPEGDG